MSDSYKQILCLNRLKLFHQRLTQILGHAVGKILREGPKVGGWLRDKNEGQVCFFWFWSKRWFSFPKRDFPILLHVDKFRLAIVLRNLFSSRLPIKLQFHTLHPAQTAGFFENRREDETSVMEWHREHFREGNWKRKKGFFFFFFLQVLVPVSFLFEKG